MKKDEYEQLELDTRSDLEKALSDLTIETVDDALALVQKNCDTSADNIMPQTVRNRYEAYGVAAEQTVNISAATKAIKGDLATLLNTLPDPNKSAVEATGSIYNTMIRAAEKIIQAAAIMKRTMNHLYMVESEIANRPTPLEGLEQDYQETTDADIAPDEEDTEE